MKACDIPKHIHEGSLTAKEIVLKTFQKIEQQEDKIGAFLSLNMEEALKQADAIDKKRKEQKPLGKLAGVPIAIKDNIHIQGVITTCASKFLQNYKAPFSASVIHYLQQEGAIFIGKTNMDEFGMGSSTENSALKKTVNPWNHSKVPGGSSGGSAASVAAGFTPLALGSDTGGSIRQPASFCGIVGFKPSYGRVSRYGLVAYGSSLDQIGPFARCTEDIAKVMDVIAKPCEKDATCMVEAAPPFYASLEGGIKKQKIGIDKGFVEQLEQEAKTLFFQGIENLKDMGHEILEVDLSVLKHAISVYYIIATAEASTNLARFDGIRYGVRSKEAKTLDQVIDFSKEEGFGPEVKRRILLGTYVLSAGFQDAYYRKAQKVRSLIIQTYQKAFEKVDLIATPACPKAAFSFGAIKDPLTMYLEDLYTIPVNLAALPSISTPNGLTKEKLPVGLQLTGSYLSDLNVLKAAHDYETIYKHHEISFEKPRKENL